MNKFWTGLILAVCLTSCSGGKKGADAFGSFEANDILISAQGEGMVLSISVEEGQKLNAGALIAVIDTMQWISQRKQIELQLNIFWTQYTGIPDRFKKLNDSLVAVKEEINSLGSAPPDNYIDSLFSKQNELEDAILEMKKTFSTQNKLLASQVELLYLQLSQVNDAMAKCLVRSPINGTVLTKYVNRFELVGKGSPIVRIADLSQMILKAYVTEDQLSLLKLGEKCIVRIDEQNNNMMECSGILSWISSESEFTPKMIQTKNERVNLVYAVKIMVKNDGNIKIGMPGEVVFK